MGSNSKIICNKKFDDREKKYLDLNSKKSTRYLGWKSILDINKTLDLTAKWYLANDMKKNMLVETTKQIEQYLKLTKK